MKSQVNKPTLPVLKPNCNEKSVYIIYQLLYNGIKIIPASKRMDFPQYFQMVLLTPEN
jgi:hypothetical protein